MKVKRIEKKHKTEINVSENIRDKVLIKKRNKFVQKKKKMKQSILHETAVNHDLHRFIFETSESTFRNSEV